MLRVAALLVALVSPALAFNNTFLGDDGEFHPVASSPSGTTSFIDPTSSAYGAKCDGVTTDTAAIQAAGNAAIAAGVPLYIPPSANGCVVDQNGSNNYALQFTKPIIIFGVPGVKSALVPKTGLSSSVSIIQFVGDAGGDRTGVYGIFVGNPNTGTRYGGHALDFESTGVSQLFLRPFVEKSYFATPLSGSGASIYVNNSAANNPNGGFAYAKINDNVIGSGISLNSAGDSIQIQHNAITQIGSNNANPGVYANLIAGAGDLQIINNNCGIDQSCVTVDCATTVHIAGNEFEHNNVTNSQPLVYLSGAVCFVTGGDVSQNEAQAVSGSAAPLIVKFDHARGVSLDQNRIATPTNYIPVSITSNGDTNIVGANNKFFTATTFISDASTSTRYANAQYFGAHTVHAGSCAANTTCFFADELSTTELNTVRYSTLVGLFRDLQVKVISGAPGAGQSYTITLRDNQADTTLTCTISGASTNSCADVSHNLAGAAGDIWDIKIVTSTTAAAASDIAWQLEFDPSVQ